jgi:hypothetical protein
MSLPTTATFDPASASAADMALPNTPLPPITTDTVFCSSNIYKTTFNPKLTTLLFL